LNVLQTKNWKEFNDALPRAWYIPSHSLVYADVEGNYGYIGVAQTPVRKNWDGLLPVPGKDSKYEWAGYVPFDKLPKSLNGAAGFCNSSNNDVVPKIVPGYRIERARKFRPAAQSALPGSDAVLGRGQVLSVGVQPGEDRSEHDEPADARPGRGKPAIGPGEKVNE
jgi:acyl-homoserine lactone acylase PvdQ